MALRSTLLIVGLLIAAALRAAEPAAPAAKPDLAKGRQIAATICAACHGADGNSQVPANPILAGQHAAYTEAQLRMFKSGERKNPVMSAMGSNLSPEDMRNVAAFFATQKIKPQAARDKALAESGRDLFRGGKPNVDLPACAACHGPAGNGMPAQYPGLAGQYAEYTFAQLKAFEGGTRVNAPMQEIALRLSEKEMKALAEYIAGLR